MKTIKDYKQEFIKTLYDKNTIECIFDEHIEVLRDNLKSDEYIKEQVKLSNEEKEDFKRDILQYSDLSEEVKEEVLRDFDDTITTEEEVKDRIKQTIKNAEKDKKQFINAISNKNYNKYIIDLFNTNSDLLEYPFFSKFNALSFYYIHTYITGKIKDIELLEKLTAKDYYFKAHNEKLDFITFIITKIYWKKSEKTRQRIQELKEQQKDLINNHSQNLILDFKRRQYNDKMLIISEPLINDLSVIKRNSDEYNVMIASKLEYELENTDFVVSNNRKQAIKLNEYDRDVVQAIVKIYYDGSNTFSDGQIATEINNKYGYEVTKIQKQDVNESINKLMNISIKLSYKSIQEFKNKNVKIGVYNTFIDLSITEIDAETQTTLYSFKNAPFYLTYLNVMGIEVKEVSRNLMTEQITGIHKTKEVQGLKGYILERLSIVNGKVSFFIDIQDIYEILNIKQENYQTKQAFKNAKSDANKKFKILLDKEKKEFKFDYKPRTTANKRILGYDIKKL